MGLPGDILQMQRGQIFQTPFVPSVDLTGQTIIITGANSGLGFEAAKHLSVLYDHNCCIKLTISFAGTNSTLRTSS